MRGREEQRERSFSAGGGAAEHQLHFLLGEPRAGVTAPCWLVGGWAGLTCEVSGHNPVMGGGRVDGGGGGVLPLAKAFPAVVDMDQEALRSPLLSRACYARIFLRHAMHPVACPPPFSVLHGSLQDRPSQGSRSHIKSDAPCGPPAPCYCYYFMLRFIT